MIEAFAILLITLYLISKGCIKCRRRRMRWNMRKDSCKDEIDCQRWKKYGIYR